MSRPMSIALSLLVRTGDVGAASRCAVCLE
jgi:hypothetical protein